MMKMIKRLTALFLALLLLLPGLSLAEDDLEVEEYSETEAETVGWVCSNSSSTVFSPAQTVIFSSAAILPSARCRVMNAPSMSCCAVYPA